MSYHNEAGATVLAAPNEWGTLERPGERLLKQLIWLYFWLLLFEGALRKWVLPMLSDPLLIIRDPIAIGAILVYLVNGYRFWNIFTTVIVLTTVLSFVTAIGLGHGSIPVAVFGARIYLFHFPLIFIIAEIFDRADVERLGVALLWTIVPVTVLVALQFYSPQSAWVNRGVGGSLEGAGFSGALGYFRPPGLFSFTNGNSLLYGLVASFVFYFWRERAKIGTSLLVVATLAMFITIPLSISRGYMFQVVICFLFMAFASISDVKSFFTFSGMILLLPVLLLLASQFGFVSTGIDAFLQRFENASISEGGLEGTFTERFIGGFTRPLGYSEDRPWTGYGLGMGTNVGSTLLTGEVSYLIDEGEVGRVTGEQGLALGLANLLARLALGLWTMFAAFRLLFRGNALPWMLTSYSFLGTINSLWGQPTSLGFAVFALGLTLAAMNEPETLPEEAPAYSNY